MRTKAIFIILILELCGCSSGQVSDNSHNANIFQATNSPAVKFRQACLDAGQDEQSKAFFDCMETHWSVWRQSNDSIPANDQDTYFKRLAAAIKKCDQLLAAKKLKSNYERGRCMNAAIEKYASVHPPSDKAAFNTFLTNTLLIMVRLDKQEISKDEAQVLMRQNADKLAQADSSAIADAERQNAAWAQQAYQNQMQQQQYEAAKNAAMTHGAISILQNHMQQYQKPAYVPNPTIQTECSTYYGKTTCYTYR